MTSIITHECTRCENTTEVTITDGELSTHECRVCQAVFSESDIEAMVQQIIQQNRDDMYAARDREADWARDAEVTP